VARLFIVSNRLPVNVEKKQGRFLFKPSVGGLATGLGSFYKSYDALWLGWPGVSLDHTSEEQREEIQRRLFSEASCKPLWLSQKQVEGFYHGFCNNALWPLFHYFWQYAQFREEEFDAYREVNRAFCEAVIEEARDEDIIWVHDYHLLLLPSLLRQHLPKATIGFFLHIPFPSFEVFRLLPWRREILEGLLGADLIGFHTYDYVHHFLSSVRRILGYEHSLGEIQAADRVVKVDVFPMGIDFERFHKAHEDPKVVRAVGQLKKRIGSRRVILSIDRLDYTKGILQRLRVFKRLLEQWPEYRERVTLILVVTPSRTGVERYQELKRQIDEMVGRINGEHGTVGWNPVWYLYRTLRYPTLNALYCLADIAMVTPFRDGMNLIAKEYVASRGDQKGVLILSEMAGAATELSEALIVNPFSEEELLEALRLAMEMPPEEQQERTRAMQERLKRYTIRHWAKDFMEGLNKVKTLQREREAKVLTPQLKGMILEDYRKAKTRLLFLDYDGTLVPFSRLPERALPPPDLLELLHRLGEEEGNEVVLVSGRDRYTLERWFGSLPIKMVAEHGIWIREGREWELIQPMEGEWKERIRAVLEFFADRTPGSFVEEKDFSLVWHYRRADPELGQLRARELKDELLSLTANTDVTVLEGNKVIEVKEAAINKGRAALRWLNRSWDFILAAGDDQTDEDLFSALPEWAYTIKVGFSPSRARFNVPSPFHVRNLLGDMVG